MGMDDDIKKQIDDIKKQMNCPKNFRCVTSNFQELCKAEDGGLEDYLICHDQNSSTCDFSLSFGFSHFCRCPLRIFIARKLGL